MEVDEALAHVLERGADDDLVVVHGGEFVTAADLDDRQVDVVLFHLAIRVAHGAQQLDTADLEPDDVVRVIYHAHLVGLRVSDTHTRVVRGDDVGHRPLHSGLRFSRNDDTPSRKSSVARIFAFSLTANWICSSSSDCANALSRRLVARNDAGEFSTSEAAKSCTRGMSWSGATTSVASPYSSACCA